MQSITSVPGALESDSRQLTGNTEPAANPPAALPHKDNYKNLPYVVLALSLVCATLATIWVGQLQEHAVPDAGTIESQGIRLQIFVAVCGVLVTGILFTGSLLFAKAHKFAGQKADEAHAANLTKGVFLAKLSHELRTPLTPVVAVISSLEKDRTLSESVREQLALARRNAELQMHLIDDLLDVNRSVYGKLAVDLAPLDFRKLAEKVIADFAPFKTRNISLETAWQAQNYWINGDQARITQLLWNLLNNAAKFTPDGGKVDIRSYNKYTGENSPPLLVVEIQDTGSGFKQDLAEKIFEAFEQAHGVTPRHGGLGLGLAMSKAIVDAHQGTITGSSVGPDKGATFTFHIPTIAEPVKDDEPVEVRSVGPAKGLPSSGHILLVEDHADTAYVLKRLLERAEYRVTSADSVKGALEAAETAANSSDPIDLVVSDLGLPDGSGLDAMRQLSSRLGLRGIALTGFDMIDNGEESRGAGFQKHLTKPVDLEIFVSAVAELLEEIKESKSLG